MTERFYTANFVTGEGDSSDVSSYWDSVTGDLQRVSTSDMTGDSAFTADFSEASYGVIESPAGASDNVIVEMQVDPASQDVFTEGWILGFSSLGIDTIL